MEWDADLFDAVETGWMEIVETYWSDKININWQDLNGMDLLMTAAQYGHEEVIIFLLDQNPDLTQTNNAGKTALDIALENKKFKAADLIRNKTNIH